LGFPRAWNKATKRLVHSNYKGKKFLRIFSNLKDIIRIGGGTLLYTYYKNSPSLLINTIYPEYHLLPWKFTVNPNNFWNNIENQRKFFDWAALQLGIKNYTDWYKILVKVSR
jgi:hypothetical protein